jgi:hypothetical protein
MQSVSARSSARLRPRLGQTASSGGLACCGIRGSTLLQGAIIWRRPDRICDPLTRQSRGRGESPIAGEWQFFLRETSPHRFKLAFPFWGILTDASLATLAPELGFGLEQLQRDIVASTAGVSDRHILDGNFRVLHGFPSLSGDALALLRA